MKQIKVLDKGKEYHYKVICSCGKEMWRNGWDTYNCNPCFTQIYFVRDKK